MSVVNPIRTTAVPAAAPDALVSDDQFVWHPRTAPSIRG